MRWNMHRSRRVPPHLRLGVLLVGLALVVVGAALALTGFGAHGKSCGSALAAVGRPDKEPVIAGLANLAKLRHVTNPTPPSPEELARFQRILDAQGRYVACHSRAQARMVNADVLVAAGLTVAILAVALRPWPTSSPAATT